MTTSSATSHNALGAVAPTQPETLIRVRNLNVSFSGHRQVHAVRGVSFDVAAGEAVAIVGESGSGKSVTSRSLVGLAGPGSDVSADELTVVGRDATRLSERQWRKIRGRRIGLVFQDALTSLDPLHTVGREVTETLRVHGVVGRKQYHSRVEELLASVGIPDPDVRAKQFPHQLSGGLRQRALIASALAGEPQLLIADEPTTALDVTVQAQILTLLEKLRDNGTALLLVSHDLAVVSRIADRVLVMNDGVIVEEGSTSQVLSQPAHEYTKTLLAAVPSAATRGRRLSLVEPPPASVTQSPSVEADARPTLEAKAVSKSFELPGGGTRIAVQDVTFSLQPGQKLGIVGESGSGKSTLARLLLDLIHPDEGQVLLQGGRWGTTRTHRRSQRTQVQFVSQDPLGSFDPRYDVADIIAEPLLGRLTPDQRRDRVHDLLSQVGLDESFRHATPRRLSGGQRQRVSIARALALQPEVIICDEPVSALDVSIQAQVLDLLADLNATTGTALVFISHDLGVVHHLVDQVLVMRHGQVVESGDVDDVFYRAGHPYTQRLVAAVPRLPLRQDPASTSAPGTPHRSSPSLTA